MLGFIPSSIIQEENGTGADGFESLYLNDYPELALLSKSLMQIPIQNSEGEMISEIKSMKEEESVGPWTIDDSEEVMNDPVYLKNVVDLQCQVGLSSEAVNSIIDVRKRIRRRVPILK